MNRTVLVTGATGTVGSRLARSLLGHRELGVSALVRDPEKAGELAAHGVELRTGSFEDGSSLSAALRGVDTLALITAPGVRAGEQAARAIDEARRSGVRKIVRLSAIKAAVDGPTENTRQHARTEHDLRESGLVFVSLRPQFFMQNLLGSLGSVTGEGKLYSGVGQGRIGMIDARDVSDCLAQAVLGDELDGQSLELTGPESISHETVAAALGEALGREVSYVAIPPEAAGEAMRSFGADDWMVGVLVDYMRAYGNGFGDFVSDAVATITGTSARSIATFAREVFAPAARGAAGH